MSVWYGDNPNCGRCGHLNSRGFCSMTACIYPCETGMGGYINKPQTKADLIRHSTDEELVKLFVSGWFDGPLFVCPVKDDYKDNCCERDISCGVCFLKWLKSPADKEDDNG